jgi:transcriptional regulator with XRE-family HTH domain
MEVNHVARIKKFRIARGITQREVARVCKVTPQAVSKWECGLAKPRVDRFLKYLSAVGMETAARVLLKEGRWLI